MDKLPTLYKKTSTGKIQQWTIHTEHTVIVTIYGQVNGKLQETRDVVAEGKNLGKANATTAESQAQAEALAKWQKQVERKGYVEDAERAAAGETDQEGGIAPMLAHKFNEHGGKLTYPIFAQAKIDGIRCIAVVDGIDITLWSRTRKQITALPLLVQAIADLNLPDGTILDGELYNHQLKSDFEKIVSVVRKDKPAPENMQSLIQLHVYDLPSLEGGFSQRTAELSSLIPANSSFVKLLETITIENEGELLEYFDTCRAQGYEGCMARMGDVPYQNKRSYSLLKVKEFDDAEFPIVGVEEGRGKMSGCAIFVCVTENGNEFKAKMRGNLESLRQYLGDSNAWHGQLLTVQYQGLTGGGLPRFPVGLRIRKDN